jgi:ATP-dependent DNA helicase UvrD/PcrA
VSYSEEELEKARLSRQETSDELLNSDAGRRLVVAGPGTGKTHNFRRVLEKAGGGLALTFIRALARDLERDLGDLAQVNTYHGFCKHLAHKLGGVEGLSKDFDYYPDILILVADDLGLLRDASISKDVLERAFRLMDDEEGLVTAALEVGDYYDATGHNDVVYRVQRHLGANPHDVPDFPVVVVDEYQDFNLLETRLIDTLATRSPVLIAGDDDQALYAFKDASARFIRELAAHPEVDRFDLPYCSRCTEVVVVAVNELVKEAQSRGKLQGRVERRYLCYLPGKLEDSEAHDSHWCEGSFG